jgi:hypothetical protein
MSVNKQLWKNYIFQLSLRLKDLFPNFKLNKIIRAKQFEILWRAEKEKKTSSSKIKRQLCLGKNQIESRCQMFKNIAYHTMHEKSNPKLERDAGAKRDFLQALLKFPSWKICNIQR